MITINLLPIREKKRIEEVKSELIFAGVGLLLAIFVVALLHLHATAKVAELNRKIENGRREITILDRRIGEVKKLDKIKKDIKRKIKIIEKLESQRGKACELFVSLSNSIPNYAWLRSIKEDEMGVEMEGMATDPNTVALFMKNLEDTQLFSKISLVSLTTVRRKELKFKRFKLKCEYKEVK